MMHLERVIVEVASPDEGYARVERSVCLQDFHNLTNLASFLVLIGEYIAEDSHPTQQTVLAQVEDAVKLLQMFNTMPFTHSK